MSNEPCLVTLYIVVHSTPPLKYVVSSIVPHMMATDINYYPAAHDPFDPSTQLLFSQAILVTGYNPRLPSSVFTIIQRHTEYCWIKFVFAGYRVEKYY